jgi:hypothetical protein
MDSDEEFTFPVVDLYSDASRPKSEGSSVSVREQQKIEDPLVRPLISYFFLFLFYFFFFLSFSRRAAVL